MTQRMPVLLRDSSGDGQSWETWMSLSPRELESQELACQYAFGHTVVMGLGMGWVAINIALNPAVRKVTIIERDRDVIQLLSQSGALDGLALEAAEKIQIHEADALEWVPDEPVDFLYADIWLHYKEPQTLGEVRRMQRNVNAKTLYFWGQELFLHDLADLRASNGVEPLISLQKRMGLPILMPTDFDYSALIIQAAQRYAEGRESRGSKSNEPISLRPIIDEDLEFLRHLYASSREGERTLVGWEPEAWEAFIQMQFQLQHAQYLRSYIHPSFDIIQKNGIDVGRLYVDRQGKELRIIDIIVRPEFQRQGIATSCLKTLIREADGQGIPVSLHVEPNNPILAHYLRLGFVFEAEYGGYHLMVRPPAPSRPGPSNEVHQSC